MTHTLPRRLGFFALVLALLVGGVIVLLATLGSRDSSTFHAAAGPGQAFADQGHAHLAVGAPRPAYDSQPPTSGPHVPAALRADGVALSDDQLLQALELGNVVLAYENPRLAPGLRRLSRRIGAPFSPELAATGQAVVLARRPGTGPGVTALAWAHLLRSSSPSDPALQRFASYWLGRGSGR